MNTKKKELSTHRLTDPPSFRIGANDASLCGFLASLSLAHLSHDAMMTIFLSIRKSLKWGFSFLLGLEAKSSK
jgi:hypothetical protein